VSASLDGVDLPSRKCDLLRGERREEERERVFLLRAFCACFVLAVLLAVSAFGLVFVLFFVL
jgi:hypothetical protein